MAKGDSRMARLVPPHLPPMDRPEERAGVSSYWERTLWPLQSLFFLLPLLVLYQVGTVYYAPGEEDRLPRILAESMVMRFFDLFGVTGYYLPGLLLVGVLFSLHVVRRDPWLLDWRLYPVMLLESLLLAVPLFIFGLVLMSHAAAGIPEAMGAGKASSLSAMEDPTRQLPLGAQLILSLGAGMFEELTFRLIGIALIHLLLVDLLGLPERWGAVAAVMATAVGFAFYHFSESNPFEWSAFLFYTAAGIYLAAVYLVRGFGIAATTHALYNVMVFTLPLLMR